VQQIREIRKKEGDKKLSWTHVEGGGGGGEGGYFAGSATKNSNVLRKYR
jgi:hypothetical protein